MEFVDLSLSGADGGSCLTAIYWGIPKILELRHDKDLFLRCEAELVRSVEVWPCVASRSHMINYVGL